MVSLQAGRFVSIPFKSMLDPKTGRARTRLVDVDSTRYHIARRYMVRLRKDDFEDAHELAKLAATAGLSNEDFQNEFGYIVANEPRAADWEDSQEFS
jgi:6-phosphofructokinase 1